MVGRLDGLIRLAEYTLQLFIGLQCRLGTVAVCRERCVQLAHSCLILLRDLDALFQPVDDFPERLAGQIANKGARRNAGRTQTFAGIFRRIGQVSHATSRGRSLFPDVADTIRAAAKLLNRVGRFLSRSLIAAQLLLGRNDFAAQLAHLFSRYVAALKLRLNLLFCRFQCLQLLGGVGHSLAQDLLLLSNQVSILRIYFQQPVHLAELTGQAFRLIFNFLQRFAQLRRIAADLDRQAFDFIVCHAPHSLQSSGAISPGLALFVPCARRYSDTPAPPLCGSVRRYTHRAARSGIANSPSGRPQQSSGQYTQTQAVSTRT